MLTFFDIMFSIYENTLFLYLLKKQVAKFKILNPIPDVVAIALATLVLLTIQYCQIQIPDIFPFIILIIYTKFESKCPTLKCIMWSILDVILFMGTLTLISGLFNLEVGMNGVVPLDSTSVKLLYMTIANSALGIVVSIAMRFTKEKNLLSIGETLIFVLILLLCFIINEVFFYARLIPNSDNIVLIGSICAFILTLLTMVLYELLVKNIRKTRDYELAAKTSLIVTEHQDELKTIYNAMLSEQHDLKHRLTAIEEILSDNQVTKIPKEDILSLLSTSNPNKIYFTGNIAVDAIIRAKSILMEQNNIEFIFIEYPLHTLPIPGNDFCMLIGNILDNAIEAVMRLDDSYPNKQIKLRFHKAWNMFFITCENDVNPSHVNRNGDEFISSKQNPNLHGFGTRNNKKIVESFGGSINYVITDSKFIVNIILGLKE